MSTVGWQHVSVCNPPALPYLVNSNMERSKTQIFQPKYLSYVRNKFIFSITGNHRGKEGNRYLTPVFPSLSTFWLILGLKSYQHTWDQGWRKRVEILIPRKVRNWVWKLGYTTWKKFLKAESSFIRDFKKQFFFYQISMPTSFAFSQRQGFSRFYS